MDSTTHIWQAYHTKLRAFISSRVNNSDVADDILQDVFLKTHTRLGDLREETRLQSWLYQIARNAITDYYRAPKMQVADAIDLPEESHDVGQRARRDLAECLRPMIDSLPPHYRDAIVLADLDGLTQQQIADRESISLSGAKSRVQRGRAMLKDLLDQCCRFEFDRRGHVVGFQSRACDDECGECN
ncbi:MAG: RNA polymerase sigma factor SigZ [bacterium]|nr:RNA polymerase sigma factor SigZ [Candidatus Kapabacteria bacterium]